jgi:hemerythrin
MWAEFISGEDFPNLGYAALDQEHQQIAILMNNLHNAILQCLPVSEQRFLLHELEVYLRINCRAEEQMMEQDGFPNTLGHKQAHLALIHKLHHFEETVLLQNPAAILEELRFIRQMILQHVQQEDTRIANWHRIQNISPDSPD